MTGIIGASGLSKKLDQLGREMTGKPGQQRLESVALKSLPDVNAAVPADIGDQSMSGWRRGAPIPVTASVQKEPNVAIVPTERSAGQWRVLETGRNQGNAGGLAGPGISADGTTRRNKNGKVRKVRARKGRRWNGTTEGKDTWSDAADAVKKKYRGRMGEELADAMSKVFTKG